MYPLAKVDNPSLNHTSQVIIDCVKLTKLSHQSHTTARCPISRFKLNGRQTDMSRFWNLFWVLLLGWAPRDILLFCPITQALFYHVVTPLHCGIFGDKADIYSALTAVLSAGPRRHHMFSSAHIHDWARSKSRKPTQAIPQIPPRAKFIKQHYPWWLHTTSASLDDHKAQSHETSLTPKCWSGNVFCTIR